jgi:hypothetical protein
MTTLYNLPDDLLSIALKYLTPSDLWRLGLVCRKFHGNDPIQNAVQKEFEERDKALILSQQYPSESPFMSVLNPRQRVIAFERCSSFAREMTQEALRHENRDSSCKVPDCKFPDLHCWIPESMDGLRGEKYYSVSIFLSIY